VSFIVHAFAVGCVAFAV